MPAILRIIKPLVDLGVTLLLWIYYILGYIVFFSPFYVGAFFFARNREPAFQKLNHMFYKSFFMLVQSITPGLLIRIDQRIRSIRSSVVVCNHISYLDPILLVSLLERQKTVVKGRFFELPVFGWILRESGYIPSTMDQEFSPLMMERLGGISDFLSSGGNLFIFPEGHRSRDGKLGPLNKGAFTIAKRCRAPIAVLRVRNTDMLFTPGKFLFNTCIPNTIEVELLGQILHPDDDYSISGMMEQASFLFANKLRLT